METRPVNFGTPLHWVPGPWSGKLALAARPRGGDWLSDEMTVWRSKGIDTVFSLLTAEDERDLDLESEAREVRTRGMEFMSFPIVDRQVPELAAEAAVALKRLDSQLAAGRRVVIHCRQGIGRTGLMAACLLVETGWDAGDAVNHVSAARGIPIPDTPGQRRWIDGYAARIVRHRGTVR